MSKIKSYLKYYLVGVVISLVFFIVGLITLSHYGNNIDEAIHFERGNAYLNLFLTGKTKYTDADFSGSRVSEWKYRGYDAEYFIKNDGGHPALNDILAAVTNRIFYEKLGITGDLEGYHLFEIFVSSLLVLLVFVMIRRKYGVFAGTVASLSMALYPLFYGESHYNIKDPIEASFFAFTLFFFYLGVEKIKGKYFLISSLFCALAFGTKFNIIFLPFIILPYLAVRRGISFFREKGKLNKLKRIPKSVYIILILYPIIVFGIHFLTRPFLWPDPVNRFMQVIQYYQDIGTGTNYQSMFLRSGWNTYPTIFVGASTPLVVLFLFLIGSIVALFKIKSEKDKFSLLLLLWFGITILRVSIPHTSIYGGVRQIMEYIPAMAAISGLGALYLRDILSKFMSAKIASLLLLFAFIPLVMTLVKMHPNENVFMNSLIGGLKGATEKKIPGAGETMGNVYLQGVLWLNNHAEKNAVFGFPEGLGSNYPPEFLRKDIKFGGVFSGMGKKGEYMMEMFSVEFPFPRYHFNYLEKFLNPVHVIYVDDVPILKIWKNDIAHTKKGYLNEMQEENVEISGGINEGFIQLDLMNMAYITRVEVDHDNSSCISEGGGRVKYVSEEGREIAMPDELFKSQGQYVASLQTPTRFVYYFTAEKTKRIIIIPDDDNLCILKVKNVKVFGLRDLKH